VLIVGERINTSRKHIRKAVEKRDVKYIQNEAKTQVEAGATFVDVNSGTSVAKETEDLKWLVQVVQEAVSVPLCIDSPSATALAAALPFHKNGQPLINSITAEKQRIAEILPLVKQYNALVVGLAMGDGGMPSGFGDRKKAVLTILEACEKAGVSRDRIYFDPVICPVSTKQSEGMAAVETVRFIMTELKGAHTTCGLSNISFGLPERTNLNRTFLALMMAAGLDGVIMDPTEPGMMSTLLATNVLLGKDEFCMDYIRAGRAGKLQAH